MHPVTIINIGDELLLGQVVNTNASTMSRLLAQAGFDVTAVHVVGDVKEDILRCISQATADIVLVTGGLGPTKDDITKKLLAEYYGSHLVENQMALDNVRRIFESRGYELTPVNRAQALVPACCEVLNNDLGTAPCMWFPPSEAAESGRRPHQVLVSLPGVPFEMEWLMRNRVIPKLQETFLSDCIVNKNVLVQGIGESFLSDLIEPWELQLPSCIRLAYLPVAGLTKLRLTARGPHGSLASLNDELQRQLPKLYEIAGNYIVGEDCETLDELVHQTLLARHATLATAESCTGGTIARLLTAQAGASAYFRGGIVAYSNEVKEKFLGVRHDTLETHGAVSEETVRQMAEGVLRRMDTDYAIATTGIAGPDGGTPTKPVGTVWIAVAKRKGNGCLIDSRLLQFGANRRQQNIDRATNQAYAMLIRILTHL